MIPHGPLDLIPLPSKIRAHGKAAEFVDGLQAIHKEVHDNLVQAATKYKMLADKKRHHVEFETRSRTSHSRPSHTVPDARVGPSQTVPPQTVPDTDAGLSHIVPAEIVLDIDDGPSHIVPPQIDPEIDAGPSHTGPSHTRVKKATPKSSKAKTYKREGTKRHDDVPSKGQPADLSPFEEVLNTPQ
ncbi:hypothetical protein MRB53_010391 [Persea americana]|uniref:Uncharacterized protein n=1 Tax=Persea americana TaxID=3435 RepID=A0ACC2LRU4_PERAE|nr:hypothetical protein MRB53_010391 [Persea americana]